MIHFCSLFTITKHSKCPSAGCMHLPTGGALFFLSFRMRPVICDGGIHRFLSTPGVGCCIVPREFLRARSRWRRKAQGDGNFCCWRFFSPSSGSLSCAQWIDFFLAHFFRFPAPQTIDGEKVGRQVKAVARHKLNLNNNNIYMEGGIKNEFVQKK